MRMVKKIALALVVIVVALAGIGLLLPRRPHVERSIVIAAPRATVFTLVNGFGSFNKWSPWAARDPQAQYAYEGPAAGIGAKMSWTGDPKKVGSGSQEITASVPYERVTTRLDFGAQGNATAQFTLTPEGDAIRVTWGFDADLGMNPVGRYFGLMFDGLIGPDYERGLAGLKTLAESLPKTDFAGLEVQEAQVAPVTVAFITATSARDEQAIASAVGGAFRQVTLFMSARGLKQAAAPITINTRWDDAGYEFDAAIPVDRAPQREVPAASAVKIKETYAGKALKVVHIGAYRDMPANYDRLTAYMAAAGYDPAGPPWDEYVTDPANTPEADLVTNIYMPVR